MHDDDTREREEALASQLLVLLNGTRGELKRADLKSPKRLTVQLAAQVDALETLTAELEQEDARLREIYAECLSSAGRALVPEAPPVAALRTRLAAAREAIAAQEWPRVGFELRAADELLARWRMRAPGSAAQAVATLDRTRQHRAASASAGRRSGEARREQPGARAACIRAEAARLEASQLPARNQSSVIAKRCGCDPSYVRKVLKRHC